MIEVGQVYVAADPRDRGMRIKVTGVVNYRAAVNIVTISHTTGAELRPRAIDARRLHQSATTKGGEPRRTGYILVSEPDGE